jgi:hypothetical protein
VFFGSTHHRVVLRHVFHVWVAPLLPGPHAERCLGQLGARPPQRPSSPPPAPLLSGGVPAAAASALALATSASASAGAAPAPTWAARAEAVLRRVAALPTDEPPIARAVLDDIILAARALLSPPAPGSVRPGRAGSLA